MDALISTANKSLSFEIEDYTSRLMRNVHCSSVCDCLLNILAFVGIIVRQH